MQVYSRPNLEYTPKKKFDLTSCNQKVTIAKKNTKVNRLYRFLSKIHFKNQAVSISTPKKQNNKYLGSCNLKKITDTVKTRQKPTPINPLVAKK